MRSLDDMVHGGAEGNDGRPIDRMGADELSTAVAAEVLGWRRTDGGWHRPGSTPQALSGEPCLAPAFATDIGQAVELMGRGLVPRGRWGVRLDPATRLYTVSLDMHEARHEGSGSSLPIAACRALLKASRGGDLTPGAVGGP